jgi:SET domain-containing protein
VKEKRITFTALRDIAVSEQLTIDYMWSKKDRKKYLTSSSISRG